jgi:hypothetical protein
LNPTSRAYLTSARSTSSFTEIRSNPARSPTHSFHRVRPRIVSAIGLGSCVSASRFLRHQLASEPRRPPPDSSFRPVTHGRMRPRSKYSQGIAERKAGSSVIAGIMLGCCFCNSLTYSVDFPDLNAILRVS